MCDKSGIVYRENGSVWTVSLDSGEVLEIPDHSQLCPDRDEDRAVCVDIKQGTEGRFAEFKRFL